MSPRGSYAKGAARRQEILDTALRVLAEKGYRNTSLRGIGRELGLEPAHVLHYFSSREKLLEAVVHTWDERNWAAVADTHADEAGSGSMEQWVDLVRRNTEVPGLVHLYTAFAAEAADPNHPSRDFFAQRFSSLREVIANGIREGQEAGTYPADLDASNAALRLIAFSDGLQLQWLIDPSIDMPAELAGAIASLKVGAVASPHG